MDLKLLKMLCKDSKQHYVMFPELYSVSSLLCIAQNVRFEIPYKVLYFKTPFLIIFKYYAWVSCGTNSSEVKPDLRVDQDQQYGIKHKTKCKVERSAEKIILLLPDQQSWAA